jgi:hypothetical protein
MIRRMGIRLSTSWIQRVPGARDSAAAQFAVQVFPISRRADSHVRTTTPESISE